ALISEVVGEAVRPLVGLGVREAPLAADERLPLWGGVDDLLPQVGEVVLHGPPNLVRRAPREGSHTPNSARPASTRRHAPAVKRARRAGSAHDSSASAHNSASIGASTARTASSSLPSRSTRSRSATKRDQFAGSLNSGGTAAGGNVGTYTLTHGLPRAIQARIGAPLSTGNSATSDAVVAW